MATAKELRRYRVLKDTREQTGWNFPSSEKCEGTFANTMKTGDYTLYGFEDSFCVERKGSTGEVSMNIFQPRFERELQRLDAIDHSFVVCEFTMADVVSFPFNSGIPRSKWDKLRVTPQVLMKRIIELQLKYLTSWVFAGTNGREFCSSLFKRIIESERCEDVEDH